MLALDIADGGSVITGGAIGAAAVYALTLIRSTFRDSTKLSNNQLTRLNDEFDLYRIRADAAMGVMTRQLAVVTHELSAITAELVQARDQLRACRSESHELKLDFDRLRAELQPKAASVEHDGSHVVTVTTADPADPSDG